MSAFHVITLLRKTSLKDLPLLNSKNRKPLSVLVRYSTSDIKPIWEKKSNLVDWLGIQYFSSLQYFTSPDGDMADAYAKEAALPVIPSITAADFNEEDLAGPHGHKRKRDEVMEADAPDPSYSLLEPVSSKSKTDETPQVPVVKEPQSGKSKNKFAPDLLPLRVMPKVKWTELKKRYLDLQKASYKALKQKLKLLSVGDEHSETMDGNEDGVLVSDEEDDRMDFQTAKGKKSGKKNGWTKKIEFQIEPAKILELQKGVIVHLKLISPITDKKQVILSIRRNKNAKKFHLKNR